MSTIGNSTNLSTSEYQLLLGEVQRLEDINESKRVTRVIFGILIFLLVLFIRLIALDWASGSVGNFLGLSPVSNGGTSTSTNPASNGSSQNGGTTSTDVGGSNGDLGNGSGSTVATVSQPGPQGPAGLTGPAGATGADGVPGVDGAAGPTGAIGAIGPQGIQGITGPQGEAVPAGAAGPQGPAGAAGAAGAIGPAGPQGPAGAEGLPGTAGAQGVIGPAGPQGAAGPAGPPGPAGPAGAAGVAGADGATGAQGPTGATGAQGPAGRDASMVGFANGQATLGNCDNSVNVSMRSRWNQTLVSGGTFTLSKIKIYNVSSDCDGLTLSLDLLDSSGAPLLDNPIEVPNISVGANHEILFTYTAFPELSSILSNDIDKVILEIAN